MLRLSSGIALALLVLPVACDDGGTGHSDSFHTETTGTIELDVALSWSVGESEESDPLPDGVVFDEDEWEYRAETTLVLGPLEECAKPFAERAPEAVCRWDVPSSHWSGSIDVRDVDGVLTLGLDVFAGDADSDGGTSLPISAVPTEGSWRFDFSPDNASGAWGHFRSSITRLAAPSR
jgi:hypothetical protein